jgi:phospholipase/carboxylesterase
MQAHQTNWSGLDCVVVEPSQPPVALVVFCHGYGAPGTDLIDLAPALVSLESKLAAVGFVFPAAPLSLADQGLDDGRAWWPIDMLELIEAVQSGRVRDLRTQVPPTLAAVRKQLKGVLEEACRHWQLDSTKAFVGGFSQGSMITAAVALQEQLPIAGLCILSGTLLCEADWRKAVEVLQTSGTPAFPVFQSHGTNDPLLPFDNAEALYELLSTSGHPVEFVPFAGQHQIPQAVLQKLARWLGKNLPA